MDSLDCEFKKFSEDNYAVDEVQLLIEFSQVLLRSSRVQEAVEYAINALSLLQREQSVISVEQYQYFAECFYAAGDIQSTLHCFQSILEIQPKNSEILTEAGLYSFLLNNFDSAEAYFLRAYEESKENYRACDGLAHIYQLKNDITSMKIFGNKALLLKDEEAFSSDNLTKLSQHIGKEYKITVEVPIFDFKKPEKNIIAFSLWGDKTEYIEGAILNATLAPVIYPGWTCRFYCDTSISVQVIDRLKSLGSEVKVIEQKQPLFFGLFWRFFVADDPSVDRFIVRDCDCIINCQERIAVDEWIQSGKYFHVMRDYGSHTELIHAGMWGAVKGAIPKMSDLIVNYYDNNLKERTIDQRFLRHYIWPIAKQSNLCHDNYYDFDGSKKFQTIGGFPEGLNVGISWSEFYR